MSASRLETYTQARLEVRTRERALREAGDTPERRSALMLAKARAKVAYSRLTGSEIGQLHRDDAARAAATKTVAS